MAESKRTESKQAEPKSKYGDLISQARKQENQIFGLPESQIEADPATEREVNLCVKVPLSLRRHWAAEAKRQGVTMTEVILAALEQRFGKLPE